MNLYRQEYQISERRAFYPRLSDCAFCPGPMGFASHPFQDVDVSNGCRARHCVVLGSCRERVSKEIFYHYSSTWTLTLCTLLSLDWAVIPGHVIYSCPVSVIFYYMCLYFETRLRPRDGHVQIILTAFMLKKY
jgi:hypothetical protein